MAQVKKESPKAGAAPSAQQPASNKKFGDWTLICENVPAAAPDPKAKDKKAAVPTQECFLNQTLASQVGEGEQARQGRLLTANISMAGQDKERKPLLILFLPFGVAIQQEVGVDIENGPQLKGKMDTCLQAGCRAAFLLDDNTVAALKQAKTARIGFAPVGGNAVGVTLPLAGLAEGIAGLK
ncbi:MAG: hypothetical protein A3G18_05325 [Rhodospirillales bacterium RIFCSPLOWO2_12_FULL_58_28]|nr:MAG: hypothetical protein A3H92_05420 [Rhodospirillales bacterium RIFCSPLOWO2_02_FULL_58_16]OHC78325.1 MAG: hypothetical protein A3G18_05325 [Rhodospirillales bacterium RIFCSPLOWO2_12_FULL_58_28]